MKGRASGESQAGTTWLICGESEAPGWQLGKQELLTEFKGEVVPMMEVERMNGLVYASALCCYNKIHGIITS